MYKYKFLILLIFFSISNNLFAQDKFEKESRIKPKDVPLKSLNLISSLNLKTKVKWYKEEGLDKNSIEAKYKLNKVKYSVEFDTLGIIEDVEMDVHWDNLKLEMKDSINYQLKLDCSSYKIIKVQRQFTGSENDLLSLLKKGNELENLKIKYEIIISCKHENKVELFEYLFNYNGNQISKSKIILKNSSHLEY